MLANKRRRGVSRIIDREPPALLSSRRLRAGDIIPAKASDRLSSKKEK